MKKLLLCLGAQIALFSFAQNVSIPDANFKAYLVGNSAINTNGDAEIQLSEATAFTGIIHCPNMSITSLTGIEAFTNITEIHAYTNQLTTLDVSQNTLLTVLNINGNSITSLDVDQNTSLEKLYCNENSLNSLDVGNNMNLEILFCQLNNISALDLSNNPALEELWCYVNQITSLDLSSNSSLLVLQCYNNQLTSLNVANGNNTNFTRFRTQGNPNLTCIEVDDVNYSNTNWTGSNFAFDSQSSFSVNCSACVVNIPDANFKAYLVGNTSINTNADGEIQCDEAADYAGTIACFSSNISDLTGIEAFTSLTKLYCHTNSLTALDLSNNTALTTLGCAFNDIVDLDLSVNGALVDLDVTDNNLSSLNVANGNNINMPNIAFKAQNNPNLTCIEVDDATYSTNTWAVIDSQTSFSENCATVGMDEHMIEIEMYPNPVQDWLYISTESPVTSVAIYDLLGKQVLHHNHSSISVNLEAFKSGVYLVKIETTQGTSVKRIVKR